ncbi:MAG: nucleotide sugar dehydrogenase [Streptomycetaceae bacterium]|nr:MAG: nucleotide sugar dehydrogenase [Streptomycetaceae bacterium]
MSAQKPRILAIIGQGYVGLPLAMAAVDAGWTVIGVDNFEAKVAQINKGSSPVEDISDAQLKAAISNGSYRATIDYSAVAQASVVTICVPTPLDEKREPDLALLRNAATGIAPFVSNETLVVSESTSYPGTLREIIIPTVNQLKPKDSLKVYFASAPERVNPGDPVWNQKNTPRLVGAIDEESKTKALAFYESICDAAVSVSSPEVAEAAKLLENTFRLVNIALVNEFTQLCSASGINVHEVIDAASSKPYGFMPFRPGVGVGGHCIPVDPLYLTWWARQNGGKAEFVESADSINHAMPKYVAERALCMVDSSVKNPKVLILGVAYKPGVGDVRETPVSELRDHLLSMGADVAWHDPLVPAWEGSQSIDLTWECDVAILATKQPGMNLNQLIARGVLILDCTNSLQGLSGVTSL